MTCIAELVRVNGCDEVAAAVAGVRIAIARSAAASPQSATRTGPAGRMVMAGGAFRWAAPRSVHSQPGRLTGSAQPR